MAAHYETDLVRLEDLQPDQIVKISLGWGRIERIGEYRPLRSDQRHRMCRDTYLRMLTGRSREHLVFVRLTGGTHVVRVDRKAA